MVQKHELRELISREFRKRLGASLEMLCGEPVEISAIDEEAVSQIVWRRVDLTSITPAPIFVGAPDLVGQAIGAMVLRAAGLEEMTEEDVAGSFQEVLQGAMSAVAQAIGKAVGRDCSITVSQDPVEEVISSFKTHWSLRVFDQTLSPIVLALSAEAEALGEEPLAGANSGESKPTSAHDESAARPQTSPVPAPPGALERILDLDLPLRVSFGKATVPLRNVLKLTTGSIVELNRSILDPVEIIVNDRIVGRGEVVVFEGNYGIRIQEIARFKDDG